MIIRITQDKHTSRPGDEAGRDNYTEYAVTDGDNTYRIGKRSHGYGGNLYVPGREGHVYLAKDNTVHIQTVVGMTADGFDWTTKTDDILSISPWAIKALIKMAGWMDITITTDNPLSSYGQPVVIDNNPVNPWADHKAGEVSDIMTALINDLPIP